MAKLERSFNGNFDTILHNIEQGVLDASISASIEETWDMYGNGSRCAVRVFERYSWTGENRVSMSVTLYQDANGPVHLCAITSGGSQATFFKLNTWGEEAFLDTLRNIL